MKEGSSIVKAVSFGVIALLFLFLGREALIGLIGGLFDVDVQVEESSETLETPESTTDDSATYPVTQVVDGDTFLVTIGGVNESVRVLGINTPETEFSSRGAECFGVEASAYAKILLEGTEVQLTSDDSQDIRDKYNRLLAYVTLPDGRDFGEIMIRDGYAYENTFKVRVYENQQLYKEAQKQAEDDGVGLWDTCER